MKAKILTLALALILALSLTACGGKGTSGGNAPEANPPEASTPEAGGPEEDAPEAGTPEEGASEPESPGAAENAPETGAPETGNGSAQDVDLTAFYNTLREETRWPELMDLVGDPGMQELLDSYYPGLSELSTRQCGVYVAAISAAVGELALVEVENAGDVQAVKDIFQARIDYQVGDEENPGGAWYPETIEGWKNKSHIASNGNYVLLAVGDAAGDAVERFNQLFA